MPNSQVATPFRKRSGQSDGLYDSRTAGPGVGFPSCCTALVLAPRNTRDPHDYYAELGVDPGATEEEIRSAARRLYRALHPDTGSMPDAERLTRVRNIVEVLLDPAERIKYNSTPKGERLNDKVYRESLSRLTDVQLADILARQRPRQDRFDYFGIGHYTTDTMTSQLWYHYLLAHVHKTSYKGKLQLLLWDNPRPAWDVTRGVLMVPRDWEPSNFAAEILITKVIGGVGNPGHGVGSHLSAR